MTVSSEQNYIEYNGDGSTTTFAIPFYFILNTDISVQIADADSNITNLTYGIDYSVSGAGSASGGSGTLNIAYASGYTILFYRNPPATQETAYYENGKFPAKSHEKALDKLTMLIQRCFSVLSLALKRPSWLADYYDAENYYIRNILNPTLSQDAATKSYVDSGDNDSTQHADRLFQRTLRVPESQVGIMSSIRARSNMLIGCNDQGDPVPIAGQTDTADLAIKLASKDGASLVATETGRTVELSIRSASGASQGLFPSLMNKLTAYRHGVEGYQTQYLCYGFGSSVQVGATLPDPSTQAPIAKFFEYLNKTVNKQGVYPLSFVNKGVNGSAINDFLLTQWPAVVAEGVYPDLSLFVYGMNDFPTALYNAGQTFGENGFKQRLRTAIRKVRDAGGDVVLTTTPHPYIANYSWSMPSGVSQSWPKAVAAPVSDEDIIPSASQSVVEFVWNGVTITGGVRFLRGNDAIRKIAVEMGCVLIDVEKYWFDAVAKYGESALFDTGQTVHPNLLGHQKSYWLAFEDFFSNLDGNGWIAPDASHYDLLDTGGSGLYPNPKTADIDLMANNIRASAFIKRDQFARSLETIDQLGAITRTSYTSQSPTTSAPGYNLQWTDYHSRTKGLYAAGEVQAISIPNRTSKKLFIDVWTSAQTGWAQFMELLVTNREGVVTYTIVGDHDQTPQSGGGTTGGSRLFTVSAGSGVINVTVNTDNSSLKYRMIGFGV